MPPTSPSHRLKPRNHRDRACQRRDQSRRPGFVSQHDGRDSCLRPEVVKAAIIARDGFDLTALWAEIDALDGKISGQMQNRVYEEIGHSFYRSLTRRS